MGDVRLFLLAGCLAIPAQAQGLVSDAFAQFEVRCLTPMIEVRESDTTDLILVADGADEQMWMAHSREWQLFHSTAEAVVQFCAVHGVLGAEVEVWADQALASGNWIRIDRLPETLQSTFLREPLIEVEIDRGTTPTSVTVIETNLES